MVRIKMYIEIRRLKELGRSNRQIAKDLLIDKKTVRKYVNMSDEEFRTLQAESRHRDKVFNIFIDEILEVYKINKNKRLKTASVYDYLEEIHGKLPGTEKTFRNFIHYLVQTGKLEFKTEQRVYGQVEELPPGQQIQLDFGQYTCPSGLKLYIFATVLSSSRYKYAAFQYHPFTTIDVIIHLLNCFDILGGIPEELVIDQDSVLVTSENKGDIIYTKDFKNFIDEMGLSMYVCRKADPESKGKIENFIKFIKQNFLNARDFKDIEEANERLKKWLFRRANGKICQATRQLPEVLFGEEKEHLRPLRNSIYRKESVSGREIRHVNDKCQVSVRASQYTVPVKYRNRKVEVYITSKMLFIYDCITGQEIAEYELSQIPGRIVSKREFQRQNDRSSRELREEVAELYQIELWSTFLQENKKRYTRYLRDQSLEALRHFKGNNIDSAVLETALNYCIENRTFSFANLNDSYRHFIHLKGYDRGDAELPVNLVKLGHKNNHTPISVNQRDLSLYQKQALKMGIR